MNRRTLLAASAGLMGCCLIWGAMPPVLKELTEVMDLWLLSALRYVLGLPVLWLAWALAMRPRNHPRALEAGQLAALGLAMTVFSVLFTFGVRHSHPVTAAIVLNTGPVIATGMAWLMLHAKPAPGFPIALSLSLAGAVLVVIGAPGFAERGFGFQGGEPLLIGAQVCWQWYSIRAQQWLGDRGQIGLSAISSTVAGLWMMAGYAAVYGAGVAGGLPETVSGLQVGFLVWISVFGVSIAVLLWNYGVSRLSLPIASLHMNATPVVAVLTSWALGRPPTVLQILGGLVVLSGIVYMQSRQFGRARA
jgi:drug/metabolite transporter (DMT)-like permease